MKNATIHPTAIIEEGAIIGQDVVIGPYCVIGPNVKLGDRVRLRSHVCIEGYTFIDEDTEVYPFAVLGSPTPDLKYKGEKAALIIGKRCKIREHVTMNPGTENGGLKTVVGDDCLFMAGSHVAHDCTVGNNVIMANSSALAGHVHVGNHVLFGGLAAAHQFVRIGDYAMIGGMAGVKQDVIPYGMVMGRQGILSGLNYIGMERHGYSKEKVHTMLRAFRQVFGDAGTFSDRIEKAANDYKEDQDIMRLIDFIRTGESRSILQPTGS